MGPGNAVERRRKLLQGGAPPRGDLRATLRLGATRLVLEGLAPSDRSQLQDRWGEFLEALPPDAPASSGSVTIRFVDSGSTGWLPTARPGEIYRLETLDDDAGRWTLSHNFALHRLSAESWIAAVRETDEEPLGRILGNAVRFVVAHATAVAGGLALHAAAVLRGGQAFVLAGPSNVGKTTAVSLLCGGPSSERAVSLGDDMTLVLPAAADDGWEVPGVPFDNAERVERMPPLGPHPLAGIWRLHQSDEHRIERPPAILATASLISCASFAWAMPELANRISETAARMLQAGAFAHLHFARNPAFGGLLTPQPGSTRN